VAAAKTGQIGDGKIFVYGIGGSVRMPALVRDRRPLLCNARRPAMAVEDVSAHQSRAALIASAVTWSLILASRVHRAAQRRAAHPSSPERYAAGEGCVDESSSPIWPVFGGCHEASTLCRPASFGLHASILTWAGS